MIATTYLRARIGLACRRGQETWGMGFIVACVVIAAAYGMFPEVFHGFFQWVLNSVFDALRVFGGDPQSPVDGPHPKHLTHLPKGTGTTGAGR